MTASILLLQPLSMLVRGDKSLDAVASEAWFELKALLRASLRIPEALWKRCASRASYVRADSEVFALANSVVACRATAGGALGRLPAPSRLGKRVLVLSARLPRLGHDGSWVLWRRLEEMAKRHRVTLFAFLDDEAERAHVGAIEALGVHVVVQVRERNPMPGNLHGVVPNRIFRDYSSPSMQRAVQRMLEGTDYDLVQVEYVEMAHLVAREPKLQKRVYVCHESLTLAARRSGAGIFTVAGMARFERQMLRAFDRTIALSGVDAAELRSLAPDCAVHTVPSGTVVSDVVPDVVAVQAHGADPTIAFVGYYKHEPNVDAALWMANEILPLVRDRVPNARLRLLGRGAPAAVLELAKPGVVDVTGYVEDLSRALSEATVVALPLRTGGGLRGKLLEAWSVGRPVVATPVACEGLEPQGGVHCLIAADARAFADSVVSLLEDESLRAAIGQGGRELAKERYSMGSTVDKFDAVYSVLCGGAIEGQA